MRRVDVCGRNRDVYTGGDVTLFIVQHLFAERKEVYDDGVV